MKDHEEIHARLEHDAEMIRDEQILAHWDKEVPVEVPLSLELARAEGTLRGVVSCLRDAGTIHEDDLRFFAREVELVAEQLQKLRERTYP